MTESQFPANPHALIKDGVVVAVVYMQEYGPEEIAETLTKYDYDKVVRWEDYGYAISDGFVEHEDLEQVYYASERLFSSWIWDKDIASWRAPVEHPWEIEQRENIVLSTNYEWDEELQDWVPNGPSKCCGNL
jgi:hypothetical protein